MKKLRKRLALLAILAITTTVLISTFATKVLAAGSYDYTYIGVEKFGESDGAYATALMKVKDSSNNVYNVYCIDKSSVVKDNYKYSLVNVADANYYSTEDANKIRNIVVNAYPFTSLENLRVFTGIKDLTQEQAIAGAQSAIWHYSNNKSESQLTGNSKTLYNWYLCLPSKLIIKTPVANIEINQETTIVDNKYELKFSYKSNEKNEDGTDIKLNYSFDKNISQLYGAKVTEEQKDENGYNVIKISNLEQNAKFQFKVEGSQNLSKDAYFYMPQEGETPVQSLVGIREDSTKVANFANINLEQVGHNLTIKKVDSLSLEGLQNAEFKLATDKNFTQNVKTARTGKDGKVIVSGLGTGLWYVKETKAPEGYILNSEINQVYINETDTEVQYKDAKYGTVDILKIDENQNKVEGAKFNIYKTKTIIPQNLIKENLVSDSEGKVQIKDLLPGEYTLIETEAPEGYIMNSEFVYFNVENYKSTKITHVNETVGYGHMNLYKKDAVTKEQLGGTKLGIFTDEKFENKIKEVVTDKDNPISVDDLRPGTYYVKELEAPEGYLLDSSPKKVTLTKGQTAEVVFYNSKNYSTAGNYSTMLIVGVAMLVLGGAILASKKLRMRNRRENV